MRRHEQAIGVRTSGGQIAVLTSTDDTMRGTYWYDLRARRPVAAFAKRAMDIAVALPLFVVALPFLAALGLLRGGFTLDPRSGFRGREFGMLRFVRRGRYFDALPQLFNVLEGTMSLVGPRALPSSECDAAMRRFSVQPGMIGPRSAEEERRYVNEWSLAGDVVILLRWLGSSRPASPDRG